MPVKIENNEISPDDRAAATAAHCCDKFLFIISRTGRRAGLLALSLIARRLQIELFFLRNKIIAVLGVLLF